MNQRKKAPSSNAGTLFQKPEAGIEPAAAAYRVTVGYPQTFSGCLHHIFLTAQCKRATLNYGYRLSGLVTTCSAGIWFALITASFRLLLRPPAPLPMAYGTVRPRAATYCSAVCPRRRLFWIQFDLLVCDHIYKRSLFW